MQKKQLPLPGIERGFHRPQRCVLTTILERHFISLKNMNILRQNPVSHVTGNPSRDTNINLKKNRKKFELEKLRHSVVAIMVRFQALAKSTEQTGVRFPVSELS